MKDNIIGYEVLCGVICVIKCFIWICDGDDYDYVMGEFGNYLYNGNECLILYLKLWL